MAVNRNFDAKKTTKATTDGGRLTQIEKELLPFMKPKLTFLIRIK